MPHTKTIAVLVTGCVLACWSGLFAVDGDLQSTLIIIEENRIAGPENIVITTGQAVIWNNRAWEHPIQIIIRGYPYVISPHPLSRGFIKRENDLVTYKLVPPGGIASYFFNHEGTFSYQIIGKELQLNGTITVTVDAD